MCWSGSAAFGLYKLREPLKLKQRPPLSNWVLRHGGRGCHSGMGSTACPENSSHCLAVSPMKSCLDRPDAEDDQEADPRDS